MKYLNNISSLEDLKKKYRALAIQYHPDKGGDTEIMKTINLEFEKLYKIWEHRKPAKNDSSGYRDDYSGATAREYTEYVYNEYKFRGSNYKGQSPLEVCVILRKWLKETYPRYKFSVTCRNYSTVCVSLIHADFKAFLDDKIVRCDLNHYHLDREDRLTERALEVMKNVYSHLQSYNFDDSDIQTDYFHTNFYVDLNIGDSSHAYEVVVPKLVQKGAPKPFKRPEGEAHKKIRRALGKDYFNEYKSRRYGTLNILGNDYICDNGEKHFYPLTYGGYRTALKRLAKLQEAGINCKIVGSYIMSEGYTIETQKALEQEKKAADLAELEWKTKNKTKVLTT